MMEGGAGSIWRVLLTGEDSENRIAVIEAHERRGSESPRHVHSHEDEVIYVVQGQVTVECERERIDCVAGSTVYLPRGSEHCHSVESDDARMLLMFLPAGLEGYFRDLALPAAEREGMYQDVEWLVTVAARYGIAVTGAGPHGKQWN